MALIYKVALITHTECSHLDVVAILGGVGEGDGEGSRGRSRTNLDAGAGRKEGSGVSGGRLTGRSGDGVVNNSGGIDNGTNSNS